MAKATVKVDVGYVCESLQKAHHAGLNGFAIKLIAESFGDNLKARFPNGGIMFNFPHAHDGTPVWVIVSAEAPFVCETDLPPMED